MMHSSNMLGDETGLDLQQMGGGKVAYIRPMKSEDVHALFPNAGGISPGMNLFALLSADGTPLMLTDRREAAMANAWENELETVSVH